MSQAPLVVDVKRNSLDDGPGIRSVAFFKGCPLRCVWCQNPETVSPQAERQLQPDSCVGCSACVEACPENVARPAREALDPEDECTLCGRCIEICPGGARRVVGTAHSVDALVALLSRDAVFFRTSGGGVTLSGGEPTFHMAYVGEVAAALATKGIHVLLETCGQFVWDRFERHLLAHLSTIYFDLKLADPEAHRQHVGSDNARIRENFERLVASGFDDLLPRVPLVPGITDTTENLEAIGGFVHGLGLERIAVLAYNPLWIPKRRALGLDLPYKSADFMSTEAVSRCKDVLVAEGLEVIG